MKQVISSFILESAPDVPAAVAGELSEAFAGATLARPQVDLLDKLSRLYPELEQVSEYLFDLLTVAILENEPEGVESKDWIKFEEAWLDRGTELLNVLVYLRECAEYQVKPDLDDFLNEFLLVEDDDFQDELRIYEPVVKNTRLVDETPEAILQASGKERTHELGNLFFPLMLYFASASDTRKESFLKERGGELRTERALFHLMKEFTPTIDHGAN